MIILTSYGMIVFHLIEWITTNTKSLTKVSEVESKDRLAFSILAIPTRHEVTCLSADQEEYNQANAQNLKSLVC